MNPNEPQNNQLPGVPPQQTPPSQYGAMPTPNSAPTVGGGANGGHNPYEFIMSSQHKPKHSPFGGGQSSSMRLLFIVVGAAIVVMIVGFIVATVLPGGGSTDTLKSLAQQQQEIVRVAAQGEASTVTNEDTRGLAYTVDLSIGTSQVKLLDYLKTNGTNMSTKDLELKKDANTDTALQNALSNNNYDSVFKQKLSDLIQTYTTDLQTAYKNTSNTDLKQILGSSYSAGKLLLNETKSDQT